MSKNRKVVFLLLILFCVIGGAYIVYNSQDTYSAASYSLSVSGATLNVGETKTLTIKASPDTASADGTIKSSNPECIQIVQVKSQVMGKHDSKFAAFDTSGEGITSAGTITIKAGNTACSAKLELSGVTIGDIDLNEHKGLSFESGTIKVVVPTTQATTVPTQPVTQATQPKQSGSNNNLLSSLKILGYDLDKKFNSSVTSYAINVQASVSSLTVDAKAQDKNAKVSVQGNDSLKSGTNNINIIVTAEDGSKKIYKVKVIKEVDPNETPEVKPAEIVAEPTNEDNQEDQSNVYLKELVVNNGKLNKSFDKKVHVYYYDKKYTNLIIEKAIPEIEDNEVSTYKIDKGFIILVENELGDKGFYLLVEKECNHLIIYIIIGTLLLIIICLSILLLKKSNLLKNKK